MREQMDVSDISTLTTASALADSGTTVALAGLQKAMEQSTKSMLAMIAGASQKDGVGTTVDFSV